MVSGLRVAQADGERADACHDGSGEDRRKEMNNKRSKEMIIEAYRQAFYKANKYWPCVIINGSWIDIGLPPSHYRIFQLPAMTARLLERCQDEGERDDTG